MSTQKKAGNSLPQVFKYSDNPVRVEIIEKQPWFIAKDVCNVLNLKEVHRVTSKLDDDERQVLTTVDKARRKNRMLFVNESGLYSLIFRSNKPEAKQFRKWVTTEVLPAIRKTGGYQVKGHPAVRNHNRLTPQRMVDILSDVCLIENAELRQSLMLKLTGRAV